MSLFSQYIGVDYSGAQTPRSSLKGLRVYRAAGGAEPAEVLPPPSSRKYWTRRGVAEWLAETLSAADDATIVGIDHGFSFPLPYFKKYALRADWPAFLDDFQRHWPTDGDNVYVEFVRDGHRGEGSARTGRATWRRLTEVRSGAAKSVFHFDVPGSVAKSTHAGLPWLRYLRATVGDRVHFWPFDGWEIQPGQSVVAEVYPRLWGSQYAPHDRTGDQHDAYAVGAWLQDADRNGALGRCFNPQLTAAERATATIEGWILGVA